MKNSGSKSRPSRKDDDLLDLIPAVEGYRLDFIFHSGWEYEKVFLVNAFAHESAKRFVRENQQDPVFDYYGCHVWFHRHQCMIQGRKWAFTLLTYDIPPGEVEEELSFLRILASSAGAFVYDPQIGRVLSDYTTGQTRGCYLQQQKKYGDLFLHIKIPWWHRADSHDSAENVAGVSKRYTYCRLREEDGAEIRLASWDDGLEIADYCGGEWVQLFDDPNLVVFGPDSGRFTTNPHMYWFDRGANVASQEFIFHMKNTVPKNIQEHIAPFEFGQLTCLKALRHSPQLEELAQSCPPLFWLLAQKCYGTEPLKKNDIHKLISSRRKEIVCRLGYIGGQSSVHFLDRISINSYTEEVLRHIKIILGSEKALLQLRHFGKITGAHLLIGAKYLETLNYNFMKVALNCVTASIESVKGLAEMYFDTKRMAGQLYVDNIEDVLRNLKHPSQFERYHDYLSSLQKDRKNAVEYLAYLENRYGLNLETPPVRGTSHIQPIVSATDLLKESKDMHNCLFSYAEPMLRGEKKSHIFRITSPERGTVEIDMEGEIPQVKQLKLMRNAKPSEQTTTEVNEWLNTYLKSIARQA